MLAVHAKLASEYPIGLGTGHNLVKGDEIVVVGVEVTRVLVAVAGEEFRLVLRKVVPRFASHHARPATDAPGVVLNHRLRFDGRRAHARSFLLMLQRNTLVSGR